MEELILKIEAELNIQDANFKEYLLENCDMNKDGRLTFSDAEKWNSSESVKTFEVSNKNISSLKGIEYFTALEDLNCNNNQLTSLDVSNCTALTWLYCNMTSLKTIYLKNGHKINGITENRSTQYINTNTEIVFVD